MENVGDSLTMNCNKKFSCTMGVGDTCGSHVFCYFHVNWFFHHAIKLNLPKYPKYFSDLKNWGLCPVGFNTIFSFLPCNHNHANLDTNKFLNI